MTRPNSENTKRLNTVPETAQELNVSVKTVYRLIAARELPVIRCGRLIRIHPDDLAKFIASRREP